MRHCSIQHFWVKGNRMWSLNRTKGVGVKSVEFLLLLYYGGSELLLLSLLLRLDSEPPELFRDQATSPVTRVTLVTAVRNWRFFIGSLFFKFQRCLKGLLCPFPSKILCTALQNAINFHIWRTIVMFQNVQHVYIFLKLWVN